MDQDQLRRISSQLEEAMQEADGVHGTVLYSLLEMATEEVCRQLRRADSHCKAA
jgi:hypothetical protein